MTTTQAERTPAWCYWVASLPLVALPALVACAAWLLVAGR